MAPDTGDPVVRPARHGDLRFMSRAHVELLPTGLFPSLGARFVRRWQRTYLDSPYGVGYVAEDPNAPGDGLIGFLFGTTDQAGHTTALLASRRTLASLAACGGGALLCRPRVAARLLRSRAWPWARRLLVRRPTAAAPAPPSGRVAVMIALAVRPQWRGSGIGARLVACFVERARLAGATVAELVTPTGPTGAATFYERLGWSAGPHQCTPDGDGQRTYRYVLSGPEPA